MSDVREILRAIWLMLPLIVGVTLVVTTLWTSIRLIVVYDDLGVALGTLVVGAVLVGACFIWLYAWARRYG